MGLQTEVSAVINIAQRGAGCVVPLETILNVGRLG